YDGGSLLEVLAQHMSGRTRTLKDLGVAVPAPVDAILRRCLARDPADRYADAEALIADLDDLGRPWRRRWLRRLEVAAALALLVVTLVLLWRLLPGAGRGDRSAGGGPAAAAVLSRPHGVAILPFVADPALPQLAWSAGGVPELLAGALQESPSVRVVATSRVAQTLHDLGFDPAKLDDRAIVRLAGLLQVDRVVAGKIHAVGDQVQLATTLHEVAGGKEVTRELPPQQGSPEALSSLADRIGEALRRRLELPDEAAAHRAPSASPAALASYAEGLALLARGDAEAAVDPLAKAVAADPRFAAAWVQLSRAYQRLERGDEAMAAAERAVATAGAGSGRVAFEARAQQAQLREQPEETQKALAALVARYPNDLTARVTLAEAYGGQGSFRQAIDTLREVVARDPNDARAWYLMGRYSIQTGDAQPAVDDYLTRALLLQKRLGNRKAQAEVHNALGVGFERLGKVDEAAEEYRQAADVRRSLGDNNGLAASLHNLGAQLLARGDFAGAEKAFAEALAIHRQLGNPSGVARLENAYGALEEERGRYPAALERYRRALKLREDLGDEAALAESHNTVGYLYFLLGEYDNARLHIDRSLALYEKNQIAGGGVVALQSRGACQLAQGNWSDALETFHTSLERSRDLDLKGAQAVAHGSLGRLAFLEGRYAAALSSYGDAAAIVRALEDRRGQAEYTLGEAETLLALGALEPAAQRLARVEGWRRDGLSHEQEAQLAILQGRLQVRRGDLDGARRAFALAVTAAGASHSLPLQLEARLGVEGAQPRPPAARLRAVLVEAQGIGHAAIELEAAEAVAAAELATGRARQAEEALRPALQRARGAGAWGRSFALHRLLAAAHEKRGMKSEAAAELALARAEATRVTQAAPPALQAGFAATAELRDLLAPAPGGSAT
ncbi:MAG TPA: tetratricopeptide repeat protein, partial [Thermoanaerobaculia bacterium]|nr:tetratricopeptide repeat protein [Thermoanaerobaculia bacterium]